MEKEFSLFRKSTFGGFNRKDVISYIEKIRNESYEYRTQVEKTVRDLNDKIIELEDAARMVETNADDKAPVVKKASSYSEDYSGDISKATKHLQTVADELCRSLEDFIEKLSRKGLVEEDFEAFPKRKESIEASCERKGSLADDILSSVGFVCDTRSVPTEKKESKKDNGKGDPVTDILSGLSFLK